MTRPVTRTDLRVAALLALGLSSADPAAAATWIDRAPVVSAVPVYPTAPECHPQAARSIRGSDLVAAMQADLERAECEAQSHRVTGWLVTYRYGGRTYTRIFASHPGRFVDVEVEVHASGA